VGLYTSPHLRFVRERIKVNDQPISEALFAKCFWELWDRLEATKPTAGVLDSRGNDGKPIYFHYLTLMAFHCLLQEKVGTAVIECGVGGEYDTTNVLERPSVTGVTSLGIDHQSLLGDTIESIAWHKGGVFKPEVPAFTAPQPDVALKVLRERAKERNTQLHVVTPRKDLDEIELGLQGDFQKINASLSIAIAACHLQRLGYSALPDPYDSTAPLPEEFLIGLRNTRLGGRCDKRYDSKLENLTWYIDGGHTLESIEVAASWFATSSSSPDAEHQRILIFNQQTRDASGLARRLHSTLATALNNQHPFKQAIFCPNVTYKNAGYTADLASMNTNAHDITSLKVQRELAETWDKIDPQANVHVLGTIEEAVDRARDIARESTTKVEVMVTGSLHLVGGLIDVLEREVER
jgi:folylpolyglutamate synthase